MRPRKILVRLIIALTVATCIITSVAGVGRNNSREASTELEHAVSVSIHEDFWRQDKDVTTETTASDDTEYEDEEDEENEEDVDEYEEELREVAESHEAMSSRDERGNETTSVNNSEVSLTYDDAKATRNFDSHEKSVEEGSDESMTSNEAISNEAETEKAAEYKREVDAKSKRVPTVKKELSTQKEIQSNETSGLESTEIVRRLEERRRYSSGRNRDIIDNNLMNRGSTWYGNTESPSRIIEKREKLDLESLLCTLLPDFILELKQRRDLHKIETEDWAQAESLMKLLVRLAENSEWWERAHRLLENLGEENLELASPLDSRKRGYGMNLFGPFTTTPSSTNPSNQKPTTRKPKRKKKKKKKKPKHQLSTTRSPIVITQKPSEKSDTHWRLVAERLFGPGWSVNREESKDLSKLSYIPPKTATPLPNYHDKFVNNERSRDYSRKFHFGKVNTHEKGSSPINQQDSNTNYDIDTSSGSRVLDYDIPVRNYERPRAKDRYDRYNHYMDRIREFGDDRGQDYTDAYPHVEYPRQRGFYDKSWRYSRYETPKATDRYYENSRKNFGKYRPWTVFRPAIEIDEDDMSVPKFYNKFEGQWPIDKQVIGKSKSKIYRNSQLLNKNRGINETAKTQEAGGQMTGAKFRSGLNFKPKNKQIVIPKLTMKTWNSLTSDPATWPFKLSGAEPWPKDKNGKTYNPNAELVRKLGLDKQSMMLEKGGENDTRDEKNDESMRKVTSLPQGDDTRVWKEDRKMWPWQEKLNNWNVEFSNQEQSSTWTPKWKQFSYHKVNAGPVAKPGTLDGAKARNSFIAMSAVTPSRFLGNDWRKNDIEENFADHTDGNMDRDDPASQILTRHNDAMGHWMKSTNSKRGERNRKDVLETELVNLRGKNVNNGINSTEPTYLQSTGSQSAISTMSSTKSTNINVENNKVGQKFNNTVELN